MGLKDKMKSWSDGAHRMPVGRDLVELPSADALNHTRNARVWTWGHACMYLRGKSTTCAPCYYIQ